MSRQSQSRQSLASRVVSKIIADKRIKLFIDQYKDPYIAPNGDGTQVYNLDSRDASDWLTAYTMDNFNNAVLLRDEPKTVIESLRGYAKVRGRQVRLELRTCADEDGNIWYDLGSGAVKITLDGWEYVPQPPILFTRNYTQQNQVLPERGGSIWEVFDHINIKDSQDRLLLIAFLVASLVPGSNKPILALSGPAGSGKSECTKVIKTLMDPTTPPSLPPITKTDELNKLALTSSVMAFDNLSSMKNSVADQFCRLATGAGVRIRKLFKTNEYITFEAIRPLIVNGISQVITQSDLLNRTIPVELTPIEKRITDDELRKRFEEARPRLLGAMFNLLSGAMQAHPMITRTDWPRMGAFAKWGYAVCEALGGESSGEKFMDAYAKAEAIQHHEALNAIPLAELLRWSMHNKDVWVGTPGELLDLIMEDMRANDAPKDLRYLLNSPYWSNNPRSVGVSLRKSISDFRALGLLIIPPKNTERAFIIINSSLPCCRACQSVLNRNTTDGPTFAEMGYTVVDLIKNANFTIPLGCIDFLDNEPSLKCDLWKHGCNASLVATVKNFEDINTNIEEAAYKYFTESIYHDLPMTKERRDFERRQQKEREAEQREKDANYERYLRDVERKKADYIKECNRRGVPVDEVQLGLLEVPF